MNFIPEVVAPHTPTTPPFYFLWGAYSNAQYRVPYFATTMRFEDAAKYLSLAEEVPGMNDVGTNIKELYQRQIDWDKVAVGLSPWLSNPDGAKFMNALTVVLAPKKGSAIRFEPYFHQSTSFSAPSSLTQEWPEKITVGPIHLGFQAKIAGDDGEVDPGKSLAQIGEMVWNPDEVHAVAIDGQHRLAGIKKVMAPHNTDFNLRNSRVPVLFILLDESVGAKSPQPISAISLTLVRRFFTDLNKHAVKPQRARLLLLDDEQPTSSCVRSLMDMQVRSDTSSLVGDHPRLPLSIVDWISEKAKFDQGPFVTTVLNLDWIVSTVLQTKDVKSMMDFSGLKSQLTAYKSRLLVDTQRATKHLQSLENHKQEPFTFDFSLRKEIRNNFRALYSKPIIHILTEFAPYKALVELRAGNDTFVYEWQHWYSLHMKKQRSSQPEVSKNLENYENELLNRAPRIVAKDFEDKLVSIEKNKKQSELAFAVVFQRSIFLAFQKLISQKFDAFTLDEVEVRENDDVTFVMEETSRDLESLESIEEFFNEEFDEISDEDDSYEDGQDPADLVELDDEVEIEDEENEAVILTPQLVDQASNINFVAEYLVKVLNRLFPLGSKLYSVSAQFMANGNSTSFWKGSLSNAQGKIDFTKVASDRASELFKAAILLSVLKSKVERPTDYSTFEEAWDAINSSNPGQPKAIELLRSNLKSLTAQGSNSLAAKILSDLDQDYDADLARDQIMFRFREIWNTI